MRILVDATAVNDGGGGICTFLLGLLAGWADAGFADEWHVVGMRDLPRQVEVLVGPAGTVDRKKAPSAIRRILTQQILIPFHVRREQRRPDVLLAMTPVLPVVMAGVPIVAVVYDLRFLTLPEEFGLMARSYRRVAYKHGLGRADGMLAISQFTCDEVKDVVRSRRSDPQVVHLGADHVDKWTQISSPNRYGITFAHWSNKRPDLAIRAWAILRERDPGFSVGLHVVGTRPANASYLGSLARDMDIADLVTIHPFLADEPYQSLFTSSSVVLLTSTMEGFGLPVAEAQRLGIPVVASAVGAVKEVGGDGALYAETDSPEEFADLSAAVLFDPVRRRNAIERGRGNAEAFTWLRSAQVVRGELEKAVRRSRAPG